MSVDWIEQSVLAVFYVPANTV